MNRTYDSENVFAKILKGDLPCVKLYENEICLAIMDMFPQAPGHILVIPKAPSCNLLDASPQTLSSILPVIQKLAIAARKAFNADGITIMQFNGEAAGQTVFHLHFHIVPRQEGHNLKPHNREAASIELLTEQAKKIKSFL